MPSINYKFILKSAFCLTLLFVLNACSFSKISKNSYNNKKKEFSIRNSALCNVQKEIYVAYTEPKKAPMVGMSYRGQGLHREETRSYMRSSDWAEGHKKRYSKDNGKTWSNWESNENEKQEMGDFTQSGGESQSGTGPYDPISNRLIKPVFQRILQGKPETALSILWGNKDRLFWDHGFYQLSDDNGKTWSKAYQLKYEIGADFDPNNWVNKDFLFYNEMYIGNAIVLSNGSVIICATVPVPYHDDEDLTYPSIFPNTYRENCVAGAICFVGKWNKLRKNYDWMTSNAIFLPRKISSRGLVELEISELKNGNLLLIMRGSNAKLNITESPGRKWYSVSKDGGLTWGPVKDLRYDTGEQFYSSATYHKIIRSSKTGKLYWIGNINTTPANGNYPRYPLQIAEIDENKPSLKKSTVTIIDDRGEGESEFVQLSNFSILENRETKDIEIYLTRLGENGGGADVWTANSYKYTLSLFTNIKN
ncbi:sialidase family protein [Petrimonas sp.]|uniref:sialidase family protein n=1 Tax=Petrimonas sp. TaxID=2023866 RepID=UPI002FCC8618